MTRSYSVRRFAPLLMVLPLLLAGCGDDEKKDDAERDAHAQKELSAGLYDDRGGDDEAAEVLSRGDADCVASELLDTFEVEGLGKIGVLGPDGTWNEYPGKLELADGERWIGAFDTCLDMRSYLWGQVRVGILVEYPEQRETPEPVWAAAEKCLLDRVTEAEATSELLGKAIGSDAVSAASRKAYRCLQPLIG